MLRHYYHKYDANSMLVYGNNWWLQSFTPDASFTCTGISVFLSKVGTPTGTLSLVLYLADVNGEPTGAALSTVTLSYTTLDTIYPGIPIRAMFSPGVALTSGTMYVFVLKLSAGNATNAIKVTYLTAGDYAGGATKSSTNGGTTWNDTTNDIMFDVWDANNVGVKRYFAVSKSTNIRFSQIYRDASASTIERSEQVSVGTSYGGIARSNEYVYVSGAGSLVRYDKLGVIDPGWTKKVVSPVSIDADQDGNVAYSSGSSGSSVGVYNSSGVLLWSQSIPMDTVALHPTLNYLCLGYNAPGGAYYISYRQDKLTNTNRQNMLATGQGANGTPSCFLPESNNYFFFQSTTTAYSSRIVKMNVPVTPVWSYGWPDFPVYYGGATDIVYSPSQNMVLCSTLRSNNVSLIRLNASNGNLLGVVDIGVGVRYLYLCRDNKILASGLYGSDGVASSSLREMSADGSSILWRFDSNFNLDFAGVIEGFTAPPVIETESTGGTFEPGDTVNLFVTASGTEPLGYQWYKDGSPIDGATLSTHSFTVAKTSAGTYYCIVTNDYGTDQSSDMDIIVQYQPEILAQSGNRVGALGGIVTLFIVADGLPSPTYHWCKDGVLIPGATSDSITMYVGYADAGVYACVASNIVGSVTSDPIRLTVVPNPYMMKLFNIPSDLPREVE